MSQPLAPVPLPIYTADGAKCKTVKSKLNDASTSEVAIVPEPLLHKSDLLRTYFLDLIAFIRTISLHSTNRSICSLAWQVMKVIHHQFTSIFLLCDTYCIKSVKAGECVSRGQGKRYVLSSPDMKIPSDFDDFLQNGDNKWMFLGLTEQSLIEGTEKLGPQNIFFSNVEHCYFIDTSQTQLIPVLASDHEEVDTKLVALVHAAQISPGQSVMIRSPSGNVDILVLFLLHFARLLDIHCLVDNGTGKKHKITDMSTTGLSVLECQALAGIHAFSRNDYISSSFRKGKKYFWKKVRSNQQFLETFANLGRTNELLTFRCYLLVLQI